MSATLTHVGGCLAMGLATMAGWVTPINDNAQAG